MLVNWGLIAGIGAAAAAVAGIVYYRDKIVSGVTGAGFTAGQSIGAIPSSIAGGLQSGLNPLREVLGQPQASVPTYNYRPPVINTNPAVQAATQQQLTAVAPVPLPAPAFQYKANPSSQSTRSYAASRGSSRAAGSQTQTLVKQTTQPSGRVKTTVSSTPGVSAYYAGTPTARSTINFGKTKVTTQLSQAAISYYKSRGVSVTPA